jgi:hypothetical protein
MHLGLKVNIWWSYKKLITNAISNRTPVAVKLVPNAPVTNLKHQILQVTIVL